MPKVMLGCQRCQEEAAGLPVCWKSASKSPAGHRRRDVIKTRKLQDGLTLLTPSSTQEGHTYSLGSYFGFMGFRQALFLSAQGVI